MCSPYAPLVSSFDYPGSAEHLFQTAKSAQKMIDYVP